MLKKVLIVDDQPAIRRLVKEFLTMEDYLVETAADGYEALKKTESFKPDLILVDLKMPGINGVETLKKVKEMGLETKGVLMTGLGEGELELNPEELRIVGILNKPFDLSELAEIIRANI